MMDFLRTGRQLLFAAAVYNIHLFGAQTLGAAGCIHGHVSAAHHGHALCLHHRSGTAQLVSTH